MLRQADLRLFGGTIGAVECRRPSVVEVFHGGVSGRGLRSTEVIERDQVILQFTGQLLTLPEFAALPDDLKPFPHQVGASLMFGPTSTDEVGPGEMLNHSCSPNTGFNGPLTVVAIRDIAKGEELTIDYAFSESFPGFEMVCNCGCPGCRKVIRADDWKAPELQAKYFGYFQPYLKELMVNAGVYAPSSDGDGLARRYEVRVPKLSGF